MIAFRRLLRAGVLALPLICQATRPFTTTAPAASLRSSGEWRIPDGLYSALGSLQPSQGGRKQARPLPTIELVLFPGEVATLEADYIHAEFPKDGSAESRPTYTVFGKLLGVTDSHARLVVSPTLLMGEIQSPQGSFALHPAPSGYRTVELLIAAAGGN